MTPKELADLRERHEKAQRKAAQLQGRRDQLLTELKQEFGLGSLADADAEIERVAKEVRRLEKEEAAALAAYEAEFGDRTGDEP